PAPTPASSSSRPRRTFSRRGSGGRPASPPPPSSANSANPTRPPDDRRRRETLVVRHSRGGPHHPAAQRGHPRGPVSPSPPCRVGAGEEVESHEDAAVEAACTALRESYPQFGRVHPQAWDRLAHDLRLVLRADVRAMLADDANALDDNALHYLRSIWAAYQVTP